MESKPNQPFKNLNGFLSTVGTLKEQYNLISESLNAISDSYTESLKPQIIEFAKKNFTNFIELVELAKDKERSKNISSTLKTASELVNSGKLDIDAIEALSSLLESNKDTMSLFNLAYEFVNQNANEITSFGILANRPVAMS